MRGARRRALAVLAGTVALASIVSACSGAVGTSGEQSSAIAIETSPQFVSIENRGGDPLVDVQVTIDPVGSAPTFSTAVARIEPGEKRRVPLVTFRNPQGAAMNMMFVRPDSVVVSAVGPGGQRHQQKTRWQ
jgi:hypothetical protein